MREEMREEELQAAAAAFEEEVRPEEWTEVPRKPIPETRRTKLVSIRVSDSLHEAVRDLADTQGISFSDIVRSALTGYLARHSVETHSFESLSFEIQEFRALLTTHLGRPHLVPSLTNFEGRSDWEATRTWYVADSAPRSSGHQTPGYLRGTFGLERRLSEVEAE